MEKSKKVKYISFGSGLFVILLGITLSALNFGSIGSALFLGGLICGILPYGLFTYFQQRKFENIEKHFPSFLRDLAESIKSGISLPQAFQSAGERDYGRLTPYIKKVGNQLSWGIPFPEALERLSKKMEGSGLIQRSLAIILQSYLSGGDIGKTMDTIARDVTSMKEAEAQRRSALHQQVVIIYVIFFVFVIIIISLYKMGIARMLGTEVMTQGGFLGTSVNMCSVNVAGPICSLCPIFHFGPSTDKLCYYKMIFMLMILVQGLFNGLVAGQVGEGKIVSGFKHSFIMVFVGLLLYLIII